MNPDRFLNLNKVGAFTLLVAVSAAVWSTTAAAKDDKNSKDGKALVTQSCVVCHSIEAPSADTLTLQEKIHRKGPPLHFAGHKYQGQWLKAWIENPERITPTGGAYWENTVIVTDEGDEIDTSKLTPHISMNNTDAEAIAEYLLSLQPYDELIKAEDYQPARVSKMLAEKDFRKFKGCGSCHRDKADFGGVTGPELYTAMNRLQPAYVASYIRNPMAWEPRSMMPNKGLNDPSIYKLMNYLNLIKEKKP